MPPKKKDRDNGVSKRPRDQPSLIVAFAKQTKLQKCTVCSAQIPSGVFAAHRRECRVRDDDVECQIVFTQTAEEKWKAGLITLDEKEEAENSMRVKKEGETPTTNRRVGQSVRSTERRRATKRKIDEGESGGDDSDFVLASQETSEEGGTVRRKEEPVRTRRSARVDLQAAASDEKEGGDEAAAAEEGMEGMDDDLDATIAEEEEGAGEGEEAVDDLDATIAEEEEGEKEEEEEETVRPLTRRVTRSSVAIGRSQEDNQIFLDPDSAPSPAAFSQSSSLEVETGFMGEEEPEADEERGEGGEDGIGEGVKKTDLSLPLQDVDLDATLAPQEEQERVTRRTKRGQKEQAEKETEPVQNRRVTRRSMEECSQISEESSQDGERERKERNEREEEKKKRLEELKRREDENRKNLIKKQKEMKKKEEEERRKREEERKKDEEKKKEQSIVGLTKIVLRALEDKCLRHEKGLVPSQELVLAPVIQLEEEDPEVVPHYVYLVCKIMKRVLSTSASNGRVHDETFWGEDMRMIASFLALKDDAKLLFIRLFTRKRGWHLPEKLREKYNYLKGRIDGALVELHKDGFLENGKSALSSTEETLKLCPLEKLKAIAKDFRVDAHKPRPALINALLLAATSQRQLFVNGTPGNSGRLLQISKKHLGPVYRTSPSANSFFRALFSLYSPALTDSHLIVEDRTINIISNMMFRMKEIHYETIPRRAPFPCDEVIGVYEKKEELYEFVVAKESEERLLRALDRHDVNGALEEAEKAREKLGEITSRRIDYLHSLPAHHLQYTAEAVLTRVVSRGVDCLERKKEYEAACNWIKFIIRSQVLSSLLPHSIGLLYERLALDLHHHCGDSEEAIDQIKRALADPLVPAKHRLNLDDRAKRILKDEWESSFNLIPPTEIVVEGETIGRDLGDERKNRFVKKNENGDIESISVERVALDYFLRNGMEEGLHSEGEIWHLAFKLLFWDVIYSHRVNGAWLCELQASPVDYDYSLYEARKEQFEERFEWLRKSSESDRHSVVEKHWPETTGVTTREMKSFLTACALPTLLGVMEIIVKEPRNRRSGFPDLVMWSATQKVITVAEVKGPGDTLSTKQRLWLDFFMKEDKERVKAYLCKVTASGRKRLQ